MMSIVPDTDQPITGENDLTDQLLCAELKKNDNGEGQSSRFKNKHSLDSDEEDNCNAYDLMDEDDIEGMEFIIYIKFIESILFYSAMFCFKVRKKLL